MCEKLRMESEIIAIIVAIIGAITGSVSLAIILYRISKERPHLTFNLERSFWYLSDPQNANGTSISITIRIDNKGERGTTIHKANLSFVIKGKKYEPDPYDRIITVLPHSTSRESFEFFLRFSEGKIDGDIINGTLILDYTHDNKTINIPSITKN